MRGATRVLTPLYSPLLFVVLLVFGSLSRGQAVAPSVAKLKTFCKKEEFRCKREIERKDWPRSRRFCGECYNACNIAELKNDTGAQKSAEWCLDRCATNNCGRGGPTSANQLQGLFACKYYGRRCFYDSTYKKSAVSVSCPKCTSFCDGLAEPDTNWCTNRCNERNCTTNNAVTGSTTPTPTSPIPSTIAKTSDTTASSNRESNLEAEATSTPTAVPVATQNKSGSGLWEWLGPVLGAVATIVGAVITVVWVRDFRHARPFAGTNQSHDWVDPIQPPAQSNVSYGWDGRNLQTPNSWGGVGAPPPSNLASTTQEYGTTSTRF